MKRTLFATLFAAVCLVALLLTACSGGEEAPPKETLPEVPEDAVAKFIYEDDGESVTILGYSGIESVITVPSELDGLPVRVIAENAFRGFTRLTKVYLPDTVEIIDYAFVSCPDLTYVRLGDNVTSLNGAFRGCTDLTTVEGGDGAIYLDEAFYGCIGLTKGRIPATAQSALSAYEGCLSLSDVTIAEGITVLERTFTGCTALQTVVLPSSVTETVDTFAGCTTLTTVTGGEGIAILRGTFADCPLLTSVALGEQVTALEGAFLGCSSLVSVTGLPDALDTYVASFTGCRSLTELFIPAIRDEAALEEYDLADDLKGCDRLVNVTVLAEYRPKTDFCRLFGGLPSLESVTMTDDAVRPLLRIAYTFSDVLFTGTNKTLDSAIKKWKKASQARTTPSYGTVGETPYTHVYGGDVDIFVPEDVIDETDVAQFTPFTKSYYWCGYPDGGDRKEETVGIERIYSFTLRATGKNDGTLPQSLTVNGMLCRVE